MQRLEVQKCGTTSVRVFRLQRVKGPHNITTRGVSTNRECDNCLTNYTTGPREATAHLVKHQTVRLHRNTVSTTLMVPYGRQQAEM